MLHCAMLLSFRFHKKLPKPCEDTVNLASCLISLFRVRAEQSFWLASPAVRRLTKTLASCFAQHAELAIEKAMRRDCPDPCLESKYHPVTASSRRKGSKALQMVLIQRFAAKGGGFVTCKNEQSLQSLGVVQAGSSLATRTDSEYCVRALCATANFCADYIDNARLKVINFAMDAASIGGEHATRGSFEPYISFALKDSLTLKDLNEMICLTTSIGPFPMRGIECHSSTQWEAFLCSHAASPVRC